MENTRNIPLRARLSTRNGALAVAVIAGGLAAILVFAAINSARKDGTASTAPRTVLVADQVIPKGSSGETIAREHLFRVAKVSDQALVAGAVADVSALRDKIATADIYPGQQISTQTFGARGGDTVAKLSGTDRAVSIPVDAAHGLVGQVTAGSHVDVIAGFNAQTGSGNSRPVMRTLATNLSVLKVEKEGGGSSNGDTNVTLRSSATMAAELAFAVENGKVWIVLRPAAGAKDVDPRVVTADTLLFGVKPLQAGGVDK
jgi:Flp pilus assembly protein CpaB